ncbi:MAG: adenylate kinase [Bacilli bacterium]|nr:adenylate kinase [Bacilli bacterium]
MKNIIFIAPPAAGKGTQAAMLKEKHNMSHISVGELLRREVSSNSEIGNSIKGLMKEGLLVDDKIAFKLLEQRLMKDDLANGYILDGFPRNLDQAIEYDKMVKRLNLSIDYVIYFNISREEAMKRITGRISCPSCGAVYNEYLDTFDKPGFCNKCFAKLRKRSDDNETTFNHRFDTYMKRTQPVIDYYQQKGILHVVEASGSREDTFSKIESIIGGEEK